MKKKAKKRPQDLTVRDRRSYNKRLARLEKRQAIIVDWVTELSNRALRDGRHFANDFEDAFRTIK